jgi:hypothetical protein
MRERWLLPILAGLLLMGCSPQPVAGALHVENRGGPDLVFRVSGAPDVRVPCDGGATLVPGTAGMPNLPWSLEVRRSADGSLVLAEEVTQLPRWFVQIGGEVIGPGLNASPIEGPPGPACPG